jgi:hypothetical protein
VWISLKLVIKQLTQFFDILLDTLIVDSGSSNTWVGADKPYVKTSTSHNTGAAVYVRYGSGYFRGEEYIDQVTLSSSLVIPKQSIGVASYASGFSGVDGILGIGPTDLTQGTVTGQYTVPTVIDNLWTQVNQTFLSYIRLNDRSTITPRVPFQIMK